MPSVNYDLITQKIYSIAQQKRTFTLNLSSIQAIDPGVVSLEGVMTAIESKLSALSVATSFSEEDDMLLFVAKAKTLYETIPPSLVGARYESDPQIFVDPVVTPPVYNNTVNIDSRQIVIDFNAATMSDARRHAVGLYNGISRVTKPTYRQNVVAYTGRNGFIKIPESSDMLLGVSNFTYDVRFNMGSGYVIESENSIRALPIIDTRGRDGKGFVAELLLANTSANGKRAWLCYREGSMRQVAEVSTVNMFNGSAASWIRLSVVGKYGSRSLYWNGIRIISTPMFINITQPLPLYLGAYSAQHTKQDIDVADGFPRAACGATNTNSFMYYEWARMCKAFLYQDTFDPQLTF